MWTSRKGVLGYFGVDSFAYIRTVCGVRFMVNRAPSHGCFSHRDKSKLSGFVRNIHLRGKSWGWYGHRWAIEVAVAGAKPVIIPCE